MIINLKTLNKISMLLIAILIVGCNQNKAPETAISPIHTSDYSPTAAEISATQPLVLPSPMMLPITTVTPTPGVMPMATHDPETAQKEIAKLMATNGNCSGSCFWGIIPGETSFDQAVDFLGTLSQTRLITDENGYTQYNNLIMDKRGDEGRIGFSIEFSNTNGKVKNLTTSVVGLDRMDVSGNEWLAYRPDNLMGANGIPKQILIVMAEGPEGRVSYDMILIYDNIIISYGGNQIIVLPQHILHACPLVEHNISGFVFEVGQIDEKINEVGVIDLAKINGMSTEKFYQTITGDPKKACFDLDFNKYKSLY
jgi:hypothetical protein